MKSISLLAYGLHYRIAGNFQGRKLSLMNFKVFMKMAAPARYLRTFSLRKFYFPPIYVFSRENFLLYSITLYRYPIGYLYIATFLVGELVFRYLVARKMVAWIPYPVPAKLGFFVSIFRFYNFCIWMFAPIVVH